MHKYVLILVLVCLPLFAIAQPDAVRQPGVDTRPGITDMHTTGVEDASAWPSAGSFLVAILAGVILAVAFQLILTNLSVAAGLNILAGVTSPDADRHDKDKDRNRREGVHDRDRERVHDRDRDFVHDKDRDFVHDKDRDRVHDHDKDKDEEDSPVAATVKKLNNTFGIWALVTASIALFFASWLAGELSLTTSTTIGAILGLVIWGMFYVFMMTLETSAVSSLVGSLGRMAFSGMRKAYEGVSSIFSKSEESKVADTAAKITAAVRDELFGDVDMADVRKQIQKYVNQLAPQKFDIADIRKELAKLLDETEIRAISSHEGTLVDTDLIVASLRNRGIAEGTARKLVSNVQQALGTFKEEQTTGKDKVSRVVDAGLRVAGMSSDDAQAAREKIEQYLRETGKEELNPEGIKRDLEKLFTNRREGMAALRDRASHIDKSTAVAVLTQRSDMTEEEARRIVDQVERVLSQVTTRVSTGTTDLKSSVTEKVKDYLNGLNNPELNADDVERDFQTLFHDPKTGGEALLRRLKSIDRETLKSIIASTREDMTEEDAERLLSRIESARDNVVMKVERMGTEVKRRLEAVKQEALHQADEARQIAATAAWWAFASAVVSGIAAVVGGIIAANVI